MKEKEKEQFEVSDLKLEKRFKKMFECDVVRITKPCDTYFLLIGKNEIGHYYNHTEDSDKPIYFSYISWETVASGKSKKALVEDAKEYLRISKMTMKEYMEEKTGVKWPDIPDIPRVPYVPDVPEEYVYTEFISTGIKKLE